MESLNCSASPLLIERRSMPKNKKRVARPDAWKTFLRDNPDRFPNNNRPGQPKLPDQRLSKAAEHTLHQQIQIKPSKSRRPPRRGSMPQGKIEGKNWRLIFSRDAGLDRRAQFNVPFIEVPQQGKSAAVTPKPGEPEIESVHPGPSPAPHTDSCGMSCPTAGASLQLGHSDPIVSRSLPATVVADRDRRAAPGMRGEGIFPGESLSESGKT